MFLLNWKIRKILLFLLFFPLCAFLYAGFNFVLILFPELYLTEMSQNQTCRETLGDSFNDGIRKIKTYPLQPAEKYLEILKPTSHPELLFKENDKNTVELPVIVSAASSDHLYEVESMFPNLNTVVRKAYPTIKVVFYDLGLSKLEKIKVEKLCCCTVTPFPFEFFPAHVSNLKGYSWKPILIAMMLRQYRFVLWMDSSVKFRTGDLDLIFIKAKQKGVMARYDDQRGKNLISAHTFRDTFEFLGEAPCAFKSCGEFSASFILIHSETELIRDYFIRPWVGCALIQECMTTKRSDWSHFFNRLCYKHVHYHTCHRYDQSVFGLLLYRLFPLTFMDHDIREDVTMTCRDNPFWLPRKKECDLI